MKSKGLHISVIAFALITSLLTALANILISKWTTINIFSFSFLFIVPAGAFLIGASGASGGLFACKYFNIKPNKLDFIFLVVVGALTMFLIYYLDYITYVLDDGTKVADVVNFRDFLDVVVTKAHMRFGRGGHDVGEVGNFGYVTLVLQFLGVLVSGAAVFLIVLSEPVCNTCNVYYKKIASRATSEMSVEQADDVNNKIHAGNLESYVEALQSKYIDATKDTAKVVVEFKLMRCPKCKDEFIQETFSSTNSELNKSLTSFNGKTKVASEDNFQQYFKKK